MKEGVFFEGRRCYRVARLFDVCDIRREMITYEVSRLYGGEYLGDCTIKYKLDPVLCELLRSI